MINCVGSGVHKQRSGVYLSVCPVFF